MKKLTRKERERLALDIQEENAMLKRVKNVIKRETMMLAIFAILFVWGKYNVTDPFVPNLSKGFKQGLEIIGLIGVIVFAIVLVLSFISYNNGRKNVLSKIDRYNDKSKD